MARSKKRFLFTSLPTDDLGLLTRSLPIAKALLERGHSIVFSNPARAPGKAISDAGFDNLIPRLPLYEFAYGGLRFNKMGPFLTSGEIKTPKK
jgi:UDP:flavonoid glycosyltransferase YjiC (YdhE family)